MMRRWIMLCLAQFAFVMPLLSLSGPALDHLRVHVTPQGVSIADTRGDILATGALPYLAWRYAGEKDWREEHGQKLSEIKTSPNTVAFDVRFAAAVAHLRLESAAGDTWKMAGYLEHLGTRPIELARFHYLDGNLTRTLGLIELQGGDFPVFVHRGETFLPAREEHEKTWAGMKAYWPEMPDPIHDAPDWGLTTDTGVFTTAWNQAGWGFGFTGPGTAFGEIGLHTSGTPSRFFVGTRLDNILLDPGETRPLESALVWHGDWQMGLNTWAAVTAKEMKALPPKQPMAGYCSWYQRGPNVVPEDMLRAAHEFQSWPSSPGGRTIQVDSGWQIKTGEWTPNSKFAAVWKDLPAKIKATGAIPGTYLVPSMVSESSPIAKEHPEWLQRTADGKLAIRFPDLDSQGDYLETDRPDVKNYMRSLLATARREGWEYTKIDFTYGISTARKAYDRKKTSFETHREMYKTFREGAGPEMLLNACVGEPGRYAIGLVDIARLGGDTGNNWKTVKGNLARLLTLTATNGVWWQGDPDVYYMRAANSQLTEEESHLLTATVGMYGGLFLTSDWPSQWTGDRADAVREFWTRDGVKRPVRQRVLWGVDGEPLGYRVTYADGRSRIALYNWSDDARDVAVRLQDVGLSGTGLKFEPVGKNNTLHLVEGSVQSLAQPAHSVRLVDLEKK